MHPPRLAPAVAVLHWQCCRQTLRICCLLLLPKSSLQGSGWYPCYSQPARRDRNGKGHLWLMTRSGQCPFPIPAVLLDQLQALLAQSAQGGQLAPCSQALVWLSHSQRQAKDFSTWFVLWWKSPFSSQTPGVVILINTVIPSCCFPFLLYETDSWLYCCSIASAGSVTSDSVVALWKGLSQLQLDGASSEQLGWHFPHQLLSSLLQPEL